MQQAPITITLMKNNTKFRLFFFILIFSFYCASAMANLSNKKDTTVRVAVIDTGFDFQSNWNGIIGSEDRDGYILLMPKLCKNGHQDFTGEGIHDKHGHGTHIAGIIAKFAEKSDYCLIILKNYHSDKSASNLTPTFQAIEKAIELKVDIINYSGGGLEKSDRECKAIIRALDMGIKVVVAAGNEESNINKQKYYPAMCDDRVIAVKNVDDKGNLVRSSNFTDSRRGSKELESEKGLDVLSLLPNNRRGYMTGTSQSTATRTGKMIKKMQDK